MSDENNNRIIVAGGGPTGLIATLALARQDIPVLLLEAQETPEDHRRATTFHPPTLEYLRELGVVDPVMDGGRITPIWQFRDRVDGIIAEFDLSVLADETDYPFRVQYAQIELGDPAASLYDLAKTMGAPTDLKSLGMQESDLDAATEQAIEVTAYNPRPLEFGPVREMLQNAFDGNRPSAPLEF